MPIDPVVGDPSNEPLLAADSWFVQDGRVRAIDRHRQRFFGACAEEAVVPFDDLWAFWQGALADLPRDGLWFPRVELSADPAARLRLRIRPAPPRASGVRVWICDVPDPRTVPRRKGPDLAVLAMIRERAAEWGAQEALLTTRAGSVLEAASSSVLWWDGDDLCVPLPTLPTLAGVTAGLIRERAEQIGVRVVFRRATPKDLDNREVWLVNALHGVRPVIAWPGSALRPGPAVHAAEWAAWLARLARPLPTSPALSRRQAEVSAGR